MKVPFFREAFKNLFKASSTNKELNQSNPEGYRGKIKFDSEKCIGCGLCTRVCAPCAITKTTKKIDENTQEITLIFDLASCTFCGMCSDFCSKKAITLTKESNIIVCNKEELMVRGSFTKTMTKRVEKKK
ncbi:4Fe-4S binding protein [Clostridium sardiniense]|uniref:4Fe-4S binding protein n=1 Tax=Clostridium sardiniense TaxID=29369 RepID=UPI003D33BC09